MTDERRPPEDDADEQVALPPTEQLPQVPEPLPEQPPAGSEPTIRIDVPREHALPDLGDITFEPPAEPPPMPAGMPAGGPAPAEMQDEPVAGADAARAAVPAEQVRQLLRPKALSKRAFATLIAAADAIVPGGGEPAASASEADVASRLDASMVRWSPAARRKVGRALSLIEWSPLASRALRPLTRCKPAARIHVLDRMLRSRIPGRRRAAETVKFLCLNQYAAAPVVERAIGFDYRCLTNDPIPAVTPLEVVSFPQIDRDHVETCDAVVVGSGAGGAVAAKELAELGMSVVIVEEGGAFERSDFAGPPFERYQRLYREQGMTTASRTIPIPQGIGVGGTTLVSAGTCARPPDFLLERWATTFGIPGIDPDAMRPFFDRVERLQRVRAVPDELLGMNATVLKRGARRMGVGGAPLLRTIEGCRGCGTCSYGCPTDANLSVRLTYLPRAQRAGAGIFANARVEQILIEDGRATGVVAQMLDPVTREPRARLTVRAKMVVLAAGALHTPALLARNALGTVSGALGENLRLHPSAMVAGLFDEDLTPWLGTMQGYGVDDMLVSHGVLIQSTSAIPSLSAGTIPAVGPRAKEAIVHLRNVASAAVFVADTARGSVRPRATGEPVVSYAMNDHDARRLVAGILRCARLFLEAGATSVATGLRGVDPVTTRAQLDDVDIEHVKPRTLRVTGWHPAATARMGLDPATSVTDPWGAVHGVAGLYVADASVMPEGPAVNPQETVMALATRLADHIARAA